MMDLTISTITHLNNINLIGFKVPYIKVLFDCASRFNIKNSNSTKGRWVSLKDFYDFFHEANLTSDQLTE